MNIRQATLKNVTIPIVLCFFVTGQLIADTIILRNGRRYYGKMMSQTISDVQIKTARGNRTVKKKEIFRISYESYDEALKKRQLALAWSRREKERQRRLLEQEQLRREQAQAKIIHTAYRYQKSQYRAARARMLREAVKKGEIKKPVDEPIGYLDFAWRSAVLPGWGHVYMDKPVIGFSYMGAFFLALLNLQQSWGPAYAARDQNKKETSINTVALIYASLEVNQKDLPAQQLMAISFNNRSLENYRQKLDRYHQAWGILATVYGLQLLHILFNGLIWEKGDIVSADIHDSTPSGFAFHLGVEPEIHSGKTGEPETAPAAMLRYTWVF